MGTISNKEISKNLKLLGKLLELHGANSFKTKSYYNGAFQIGKFPQPLHALPDEEISQIRGIGKSMVPKIRELIDTGELSNIQELVKETPPGVVEMLSIKGIGPAKIRLLWQEMEIETVGELLYACVENRLKDIKGFGLKTQEAIRKDIEYKISNSGLFHYASVESLALDVLDQINSKANVTRAALTGEMRRKCQIISKIQIIACSESQTSETFQHEIGIPIEVQYCSEEEFVSSLFETTSTTAHLDLIQYDKVQASDEKDIYKKLGHPYFIPEMREGRDELEWSKRFKLDDIIQNKDLKGALHNHSVWSDGQNTILEMAQYCMKQGWEYFGISDHSKTAIYANGLTEDRLKQQWLEIDQLNETLKPFKIFKGIESDILYDGSLDYEEEVLAQFDFVVASIHAQLKMDQAKAMERLLRAIQNPYTTILGHPTGRLLLSREGYPINHSEIIAACAEHNVIIELNANPLRLDMDWEWIHEAMEKGVQISINPDAHVDHGLDHMKYGINVARKAGLTRAFTFNAKSVSELEDAFLQKKASIV
ncbi:MAG: helix-hairpin-helix domain-containing protein [Flavobacteriales bacterium]|nr:helix-hairpin-helix domain-containing protein [Flavobacteriales bacterium]